MIVSASAGSGKTYALALRTAQFLISPRVPHAGLPNIIAMTFTNAAAEEMRRRVLGFLKEAALGTMTAPRGNHPLQSVVSGSADEIRRRATDLLDTIFARYDEFQVRTIDSFVARAFKASALEAGLPPDYDLVKLQLPLIKAAFDHYVRDASRRPDGARALQHLVDLLEASSSSSSFDWYPFVKIVQGAAEVLRQIAARPADLDTTDPVPAFEDTLKRIRSVAVELQHAIEESGFKPRSIVMTDIERIISGDWRKALREPPREGALTKSNEVTNANQSQHENIGRLFDQFNAERASLALRDAETYFWPFVKALSVVSESIDATKRARGMYSIDDVNRLLWKSVAGGSAPAIYVTLGTRLYHYLIDEFQDTSPIQWAALKILIENACAEDGTLYAVGDTKQSIYSFRGADWQIMHRLLAGEETIDLQSCLTASLDTNYRSDGAIVSFVEQVFRNAEANPELAEVTRLTGLDRCAQNTIEEKSEKGYVEVNRISRGDEDHPEQGIVVDLVKSARARNHPLGSVAILAQTNAQVLDIGGWLNSAGIPFLSYSNLDLRKRPIIMEIVSLIAWLDSPLDDLAFASFVMGELFSRFADQRHPTSTGDGPVIRRFLAEARARKQRPLYPAFRSSFPDLWETGFAPLLARVGYLPAYDILCEISKTYDLFALAPEDQTSLAGLLDAVKDLEAEGAASLKDLLRVALAEEGEEEDEAWSLSSQKKADAVTVMTIHKAKGLQFPVLIVLLSDGRWPSDSMKLVERDGKISFLHIPQKSAPFHPQLQQTFDHDLLLQRADALNRLYVALTRAEHELYVVLIEGEERKFPSLVIPDAGDPSARPVHAASSPSPGGAAELLPSMHTLRTREEPLHTERIGFQETRRGDLLHRILSRIEFIDGDPAAVIAGIVEQEPWISQEQPGTVSTLISFLRTAEIVPLFTRQGGWRVMNEKEFLSRTGTVQRMDRVMVGERDVVLVDYKTGGEGSQSAHREQVGRYLDILSDVYPGKTLRGIIAYVDRRRIVTVGLDPEKGARP